MLKKISNIIFFTFTLCISACANNATPPDSTNKVVPFIEMNGKSWVDGSIPFFTIHDVHRQAEAWAICASAWLIASELMTIDSPAKSQQFKETYNGAKIAVGMTYMNEIITDKVSDQSLLASKFNSTWEFAKVAMESLPESQFTVMVADLENSDNITWLKNHSATLQVCDQNMETQQHYIDMWRDLATSGLLVFPR
jgi:uncharacterized lipoprotein YehR (DUF1307 family)